MTSLAGRVGAGSGPTTPDWDRLAPVWECFEPAGSTYATVRSVLAGLRPPVLYLGGGLGTFPARLARHLGPAAVVTVDSSAAMTRRARDVFGLGCLQADARALPLGASTTGSAFCATGVLEWLERADRLRVLRELARVVRPPGWIVLAGAGGAGAADLRAGLDAWWSGQTSGVTPYDAVAVMLGDRAAAYALLTAGWPERHADPSGIGLDELAEAGLELVPSARQDCHRWVCTRRAPQR